MAHLEIEHLTKVYERGKVLALDDVSLTVDEREFLVLIGLSGSGKSTLLRCINRLVEPTEGSIVFDGTDITALSHRRLRRVRRQIAMIFQQFNLVKRASVLNNVLAGRLGYVPTATSLIGTFPKKDIERAQANLE
ncbi:MAG: ATP-binding cassette domain-containing protein, partial [Candidatus Bipolaricaulia bacterium]